MKTQIRLMFYWKTKLLTYILQRMHAHVNVKTLCKPHLDACLRKMLKKRPPSHRVRPIRAATLLIGRNRVSIGDATEVNRPELHETRRHHDGKACVTAHRKVYYHPPCHCINIAVFLQRYHLFFKQCLLLLC